MNETTQEVLDTGIWCKNCGWYEDADNLERVAGCSGCGCPRDAHVNAQVITEGASA